MNFTLIALIAIAKTIAEKSETFLKPTHSEILPTMEKASAKIPQSISELGRKKEVSRTFPLS